ncbi:ABC transporter ATP-binding protein [Uliginosibacterium sp. H3]|uniref:ABC transporter ATP-binding protein n=1 Tax=Uliginosibacterium silvisoli TaxID=3114758 RepID=A0ABU6K6N0_9RHOO|nr:ABC transporter ATP-binding protein [Uliginosibacterium sp. H3]
MRNASSPNTQKPLISLTAVSKDYQLGRIAVPALRGVSLDIERGAFIALWGPSGSGKSSLLNLIGLIDMPTRGSVRISDQDTAGLSDGARAELRNRTIGFVFQGFNLIPVLSALENVMLPLTIRGTARNAARKAAEQRLAEVGLADFAHHRPDQLSGGQRQRVAIARALVTDPLIVIADEPTANLDANTGHQVIALMRELNEKQGVTFLFSTHDPRLIDAVDKLIRLADGQIETAPNSTAALSPIASRHAEGALS